MENNKTKEAILNNLSSEEKSLALSILKEYEKTGSSDLLNKLVYTFYFPRNVVVSII